MTAHLINLGHRRIGFIKGDPHHPGSDDRLFGYRRALDRAGIAFEPQLVMPGTFDFESGMTAGAALLDLRHPPTAIFAANDDMAAGVLAEAHRRGLALPDQLSVAGFDDTTLARTVWPALTTIHQPMAELARTATEILINGGDIAHRRLPHTLIERASVAPPFRIIP
jgi:LacI family transcriptional regulator